MGYGLHIEKIKQLNNVHYYSVSESDPKLAEFYIGINPKNMQVIFFQTRDFNKPVGVIDFNESDALPIIAGISERAGKLAAMQALKAIKKNEFPNYIGIQS